jgi:hypothetical protein
VKFTDVSEKYSDSIFTIEQYTKEAINKIYVLLAEGKIINGKSKFYDGYAELVALIGIYEMSVSVHSASESLSNQPLQLVKLDVKELISVN